MKKVLLCCIILVVVIGLILNACTQPPPSPSPGPTPTPSSTPAQEPKSFPKLTFVTTSSGTNPHTMAVAWTTLINKYIPGFDITIEPAVGAPQAVNGFYEGVGDLTYNPANLTRAASLKYLSGKTLASGPFHLTASLASAIHIVTRAETGIKTIADLRGKKVLAKVPTSRSNDEGRQNILAAYGMTDDDIILLSGNNGSHLAEQLKEGVGDAAMIFLGLGDSSIVDLCTTKDIRWISLPQDKMGWAEEWWVVPGTIPANTYPKQTEAVSAIRLPAAFSIKSSVDEDTVYTMVKVLYDHWDEFLKMAPLGKEFDIKEVVDAAFLPFHPGSIKYYKEKGVWNSAADAKQQKFLNKAMPAAK